MHIPAAAAKGQALAAGRQRRRQQRVALGLHLVEGAACAWAHGRSQKQHVRHRQPQRVDLGLHPVEGAARGSVVWDANKGGALAELLESSGQTGRAGSRMLGVPQAPRGAPAPAMPWASASVKAPPAEASSSVEEKRGWKASRLGPAAKGTEDSMRGVMRTSNTWRADAGRTAGQGGEGA